MQSLLCWQTKVCTPYLLKEEIIKYGFVMLPADARTVVGFAYEAEQVAWGGFCLGWDVMRRCLARGAATEITS